jgi:hypothetical protein
MQSGTDAEAMWEKLRGTRWNPPVAVSGSESRRQTYVFGLEQAEQMFRAATGVGVATRPLLLFYGSESVKRVETSGGLIYPCDLL